jgi:hypothetical protein
MEPLNKSHLAVAALPIACKTTSLQKGRVRQKLRKDKLYNKPLGIGNRVGRRYKALEGFFIRSSRPVQDNFSDVECIARGLIQ